MTRPAWHTSTYSNGGTNCVEVRERRRGVELRDTQNRQLGYISIPEAEWHAFIAAACNAEL